MPVAAVSALPFDRLEKRVRGEIIRPGDAGYDRARRVWNASIDRYPAVIVRCTGVADVVGALDFARESDLPVAVRGGGHNVAGNAVCDDGLVIDLSGMKGIRVDPDRWIAYAQPGLTWREFDHETQAFGLATPGGLVSSTGIAGFTLGGGLGWLSRKHGTASDNFLAADVVTADGQLMRADSTTHTDLFWAIRGGGGNFGVVTAFEYRLHPVGPLVLGGVVFYPADAAVDVLRFLRDVLAEYPDELTAAAVLRIAPAAPFLPSHAHGRHVIALALCWSGSIEEGEAKLQLLRQLGCPLADLLAARPYTQLQCMLDAAWGPGFHNYWKAEYLRGLSDDAIDVIVAQAERITSPLADVKIIPGGGAVARGDDGVSAFAHRQAPFILNINSRWADPGEAQRHIEWTQAFWELMRPFSADGVYVNFLGDEGEDRVRAAYGPVVYERLSQIKGRYDPTNFFRFNQNIRPPRRGG